MFNLQAISNKKVIVTGGLGFIGHNLVKMLVALNAEVIVVDDCSNSTTSVLDEVKDRVTIHVLSVLDNAFLDLITDDVNYLFHLACRSIITCSEDPFTDLKVNGESTLKILEFLRYNMPASFNRFVYTSSTSVYGSPRILPVNEDAAVNPLSQYAATKMLGEQYTIMYNKLYDIPVACTRFSNVFGYGQTPKNPYCGVIGMFIDNAIHNRDITVFGDGEQTRDYTFITDAVKATIAVGVHPKGYGSIYNVATNREFSVNQLARFLRHSYFPDLKVRHEKERYIDNIRRRVIDIGKIGQDLSWFPEVTIEEGLKKTVEWHMNQLESVH